MTPSTLAIESAFRTTALSEAIDVAREHGADSGVLDALAALAYPEVPTSHRDAVVAAVGPLTRNRLSEAQAHVLYLAIRDDLVPDDDGVLVAILSSYPGVQRVARKEW